MLANFIEFLIQNGALEEKYKEDSIYGLTILLEKIVACMILFFVSFLLRKTLEGMVFVTSFLMLRQTTGGYHAKTFQGCLTGSVVTVLVVLKIFTPLAQNQSILLVAILLLSVVCILRFAPVNHPNLMLTKEEEKRYARWSRRILFIEICMIGIGSILGLQWQYYVADAVIMCAIFIILAKILKQEVGCDECE